MHLPKALLAACLLLAVCALSACGGGGGSPEPTAVPSATSTPAAVQWDDMKWDEGQWQ